MSEALRALVAQTPRPVGETLRDVDLRGGTWGRALSRILPAGFSPVTQHNRVTGFWNQAARSEAERRPAQRRPGGRRDRDLEALSWR